MRRSFAVLAAAAVLSSSGVSVAADVPACRHSPHVVAACTTMHGRLDVWNGTPSIRLWHIGTHHMLGIEPLEHPIMPAILLEQLQAGYSIYGDFLVCPVRKERAGRMGAVCIEAAKHLFALDRNGGDAALQRIPGRFSLSAGHR
jgi:hypothetical protein